MSKFERRPPDHPADPEARSGEPRKVEPGTISGRAVFIGVFILLALFCIGIIWSISYYKP